MTRLLILLLLALPLSGRAATISSATCTASVTTGCVTVSLAALPAVSSVAVQVSGTWVGTLVFEGSNDNATFSLLPAYPAPDSAFTTSATSNGLYTVPTRGALYVRIKASSWTSGAATVLPQPSTAPLPADIVRAVGPTNGPLDVSGTLSLSNATLGALGTESCTVGVARTLSVGTTAISVPAVAMTGRTRIMIINASDNQDIRCVADPAGANPTCAVPGVGLPIFQKGSSVTFTVRDTVPVKCIACNASAPVAYQEEACVPP